MLREGWRRDHFKQPRQVAITLELGAPFDQDAWLKPEEKTNPRGDVPDDLIVLVTFKLGVIDQPLFSLQAYWTLGRWPAEVSLIYRRKGVSSNETQDGFQSDITLTRSGDGFFDSDSWPVPPVAEEGAIFAVLDPWTIGPPPPREKMIMIRPNSPARLLRLPKDGSFKPPDHFKQFDGSIQTRKVEYDDGSVLLLKEHDFLKRMGKNIRRFVP